MDRTPKRKAIGGTVELPRSVELDGDAFRVASRYVTSP